MADSPFSFSPTVTWSVRGVDGRRGQGPEGLARYRCARGDLGPVAALGRSLARRARERRDYVIRHASSCAFALKARRTCRRTRRRWISAAGTRTHLRLVGALEGEHVAEHGEDVSHDYCRRTACGCVDQSGAGKSGNRRLIRVSIPRCFSSIPRLVPLGFFETELGSV